jgi:hypothetical protein
MAVNTAITSATAACDIANANTLKVYERKIDFSVNNLASGAWFQIFTLPAGATVIAGSLQINTLDAGGGTISLGIGGTGTELTNAQATSAATCVKVTAGGVTTTTAADTIDLSAGTAALTTCVATVRLLVLEAGPTVTAG